MKKITITALVDNMVSRSGVQGEHGLSICVDTPEGAVLWDTGQSELFIENAKKLGISLHRVQHIALSHGHYDHTGGVLGMVSRIPNCTVYAHPGIFTGRFTPDRENPGSSAAIGIPYEKQVIETHCREVKLSREPREIIPGVFLTGEIPRVTGFEDTGGAFFLDAACTKPDPISDDQSLIIETMGGLVVLLGCCHAGLINTLLTIGKRWETDEFLLIAGGMHLMNASADRMNHTVDALREFTIRELCPGYCTGWNAVCTLQSAFPDITHPLSVGWRWRG